MALKLSGEVADPEAMLPPPDCRAPATARARRGPAFTLALLLLLTAAAAAQNRTDPQLEVAVWQGHPVVAGELLVRFAPDLGAAQQSARAAAAGGVWQAAVTPELARIALPPGESVAAGLQRFAAQPGVAAVQPNLLHQPTLPSGVPSDPLWSQQWHLPKVSADVAWLTAPGSADVMIAVLDSGVHVNHADLAANYAFGLDTYANDDDPSDSDGHGTHCIGVAAAVTDNGLGVAGAGNRSRFLAYRCGNASFPSSALVAAIHDARQRGAHVLSLSWGSTWPDPAIQLALQAAADDGCVLVAAAGNNGNSTKFYPAAHPFVIAVGATTATDARAAFSNWGPWVDVAAPGQAIYSTWKSGGYKYMSGTSMATPIVAGGAALLYARLGGVRSVANAAAIRAALQDGAVPVGDWVMHGRVDLSAAVALLPPVGGAQVGAPVPATVSAFQPAEVTLTGSGLASATGARVGPSVVPLAAPAQDGQLLFTPPAPAQLGPAAVTVLLPGAELPAGELTYLAPAGAQLAVQDVVAPGATLTWQAAGAPGELALLLVSGSGHALPFKGFTLLSDFVILAGLPLDPTGLAQLALTVPPGAAGLALHSQIATLGGALTGTSAIRPTQITP